VATQIAYTRNTGESGTALQANGGSNVGNLTGKNSAANNNLLFEK